MSFYYTNCYQLLELTYNIKSLYVIWINSEFVTNSNAGCLCRCRNLHSIEISKCCLPFNAGHYDCLSTITINYRHYLHCFMFWCDPVFRPQKCECHCHIFVRFIYKYIYIKCYLRRTWCNQYYVIRGIVHNSEFTNHFNAHHTQKQNTRNWFPNLKNLLTNHFNENVNRLTNYS